jgi:hypothetical protein
MPAPSGGELVYPQQPPKDPVLIAVLNLVVVSIVAAIDGYLQAMQLKANVPVAQWTFFNDHR